MDEYGIWFILTDTLHYVKPKVDISVTYSYYQTRHQNFKSKYIDVPNVPIYSQALFPKYEEDRNGNISLYITSLLKSHKSICATYLLTEENKCSIMESEAYDMEGNNI